MKLTLPYPVSANRYWRSFVPRGHTRAIVVVSDEAKAYKSEVGWIAKGAGLRKPFSGLVEMRIRLVPKNRICIDLDNALKVTLDALKGIGYGDDAQVYRIVADRAEPDPVGGARLEVEILSMEPVPAPLFAQAETV